MKLVNKSVFSILFIFIFIFALCTLGGCSKETIDTEKVSDIDYTVVEEAEVPDELADIIRDKGKEPFKLSYTDKDYLYLAVGYGEQETGGYSITVDDLYLAKNSVCIDTTLVGPGENDLVLKAKTYPYIVVKMEYIDKNVVYN